MAQGTQSNAGDPPSPDAPFASASAMETSFERSPLGSVQFGKRPSLTAMTAMAATDSGPAAAPGAYVRQNAFRAEEAPAGGLNGARPVPEPPTLLMLMAGLGALVVVISRRQ
jgi:hypothetical protein